MGRGSFDADLAIADRYRVAQHNEMAKRTKREREKEIHYVHSASLAYEDGIVCMQIDGTNA